MNDPRVSILIPAFGEELTIVRTLARLEESVSLQKEILIIVDSPDDSTIAAFLEHADNFPDAKVLVQDYGRGPANAIRFGFDQATASTTVVTMADGSDDPRLIDDLVHLVERGCVIAAASRYMTGGAQIGGPRTKKLLSRGAGLSLQLFAGVGTRDATNSFKAYSTKFVQEVGIDSRHGFEIAIELVAKARRLRLPIAELPTIWLDRDAGVTNFQMRRWIPEYIRWYLYTYGRKLEFEAVRSNNPISRRSRS